jgi:hypothetical protein
LRAPLGRVVGERSRSCAEAHRHTGTSPSRRRRTRPRRHSVRSGWRRPSSIRPTRRATGPEQRRRSNSPFSRLHRCDRLRLCVERSVSEHVLTGRGLEVTLGETIRLTSGNGGRDGNGTLPIIYQAGGPWFGGLDVALSGQVDDGGGAERFGGDGAGSCWGSPVRAARSGDGEGCGRQESAEVGELLRLSRRVRPDHAAELRVPHTSTVIEDED